jgi:bifunctional non-homologous end joining protein LigD
VGTDPAFRNGRLAVRRLQTAVSVALDEYRRRRAFERTPEPAGAQAASRGPLAFVVQKHAARRLHYDIRLELDGVLKSWAVPKGPSLDPGVRSLAVETEDHPLEYAAFEGVIPEGEYGAGPVIVWDRGLWVPEGDPRKGYERGRLKFRLEGEKLRGAWVLLRMGAPRQWLLIKRRDAEARTTGAPIVDVAPESVLSSEDIEEVAANPKRRRTGPSGGGEPVGRPGDPAGIAGARTASLPRFVEPELATLVDRAPEGEQWLHEIKLDGYRIGCRVDHGKAGLFSRSGADWTAQFPGIARAVMALACETAYLDGEVVVLDERGISSFQRLQNALGREDLAARYVVFDLLHLDGFDLREGPLMARKEALRLLVAASRARLGGVVRYGDHVQGHGPEFYAQACATSLEGIVSKRADALYRGGRARAWLKVKCHLRQELAIVGFTDPKGSRPGFGALLLGARDADGDLVYAGKVGTGYTDAVLRDLRARLETVRRDRPAIVHPERAAAEGVHWVEPELAAEVEFTEWTKDGLLRHPSFQGLREDKSGRDVAIETAKPPPGEPRPSPRGPVRVAGVRITKPTKVLFPEIGVSKLELARYYEAVAEHMLPWVSHRLLTLLRCPEGRHGGCFFQKHANRTTPPSIRRIDVGEKTPYLYVDSVAALIDLVQLAVLEIHVSGARIDKVDRADILVFDLDPGEGITWSGLVEGARALRLYLEHLGLVPFVRWTGSKGLHVVVPIVRRSTWDEAKSFTLAVGRQMVRNFPRRFTTVPGASRRVGKIFVDYIRNSRGASAIGSYSARALPGAPIALPLAWDEIDTIPRWTVRDVPSRLVRLKHDPWAGFEAARRAITTAMRSSVAGGHA